MNSLRPSRVVMGVRPGQAALQLPEVKPGPMQASVSQFKAISPVCLVSSLSGSPTKSKPFVTPGPARGNTEPFLFSVGAVYLTHCQLTPS